MWTLKSDLKVVYVCDAYTHAIYDYAYASSNFGRYLAFAKNFKTICETCRKCVYMYVQYYMTCTCYIQNCVCKQKKHAWLLITLHKSVIVCYGICTIKLLLLALLLCQQEVMDLFYVVGGRRLARAVEGPVVEDLLGWRYVGPYGGKTQDQEELFKWLAASCMVFSMALVVLTCHSMKPLDLGKWGMRWNGQCDGPSLACACIFSIPWWALCRSGRVELRSSGGMQMWLPLRRRLAGLYGQLIPGTPEMSGNPHDLLPAIQTSPEGKVDSVLMWMEDAIEVTAVMEVRSAQPFSLAFWYCLYWDSSSLHWERRAWYVSWDWSLTWIQSLASWYCIACCRTMRFSISCIWGLGNVHWETRIHMQVDRAWIPALGSCQTLERSSSWKCKKSFSDLIVVLIASRASWGVLWLSGGMVPLSLRDWRVYLHPQTLL